MWHLVHSKPNAERIACYSMEREGLNAYLPRTLRDIRHGGIIEHVQRPFFPRYLFVERSPRYDSVNLRYLHGVSDVVRQGDQCFARLADGIVAGLKAREDENGFIIEAQPPAPKPLTRGDKIMVNVTGNGDDFAGKFVRMKSSDRVVVLLSLFNSTRETTVGMHQVRRAPTEEAGAVTIQ